MATKSKAVAGRQGRAVGDRPADPVCEKRQDPLGRSNCGNRGEHQGVGLDDAGAGGRGRRTDCRPCQDTPGALTLAFIPPSLATSVRMDSSVVMRANAPTRSAKPSLRSRSRTSPCGPVTQTRMGCASTVACSFRRISDLTLENLTVWYEIGVRSLMLRKLHAT